MNFCGCKHFFVAILKSCYCTDGSSLKHGQNFCVGVVFSGLLPISPLVLGKDDKLDTSSTKGLSEVIKYSV